MSIIVVTEENIAKARKRVDSLKNRPDDEIWKYLLNKTTQWVYEA